jgi:hypothetical protein
MNNFTQQTFQWCKYVMTTHHCHQSRPHFVNPDIIARTPKAVNYDLGWCGQVEGLTGPRPNGCQVSEGDVHDRGVPAGTARVQEEPCRHFLGWGREHVQVPKGPRVLETSHFWVAHRRVSAFPPETVINIIKFIKLKKN